MVGKKIKGGRGWVNLVLVFDGDDIEPDNFVHVNHIKFLFLG